MYQAKIKVFDTLAAGQLLHCFFIWRVHFKRRANI